MKKPQSYEYKLEGWRCYVPGCEVMHVKKDVAVRCQEKHLRKMARGKVVDADVKKAREERAILAFELYKTGTVTYATVGRMIDPPVGPARARQIAIRGKHILLARRLREQRERYS